MESAPWMVPSGTMQSLESIPSLGPDMEVKDWAGQGTASGSPKFWAQVELPDMFLSNLFHQPEDITKEDELTDLSGSVTGSSDQGESPEAFQDFMLGHTSDQSTPSQESSDLASLKSPDHLPVPFKVDGSLNDLLPSLSSNPTLGDPTLSTVSMDNLFQPIFSVGTQASPPERSPSTQPSPKHAHLESSMSNPAPATQPKMGQSELPGLLQMPTGSNPNALSALERIREFSKHAEKEEFKPPGLSLQAQAMQRQTTSSSGTTSSAQSPNGSVWSKKVAHNAIERRYRSNINDRIAGLRDVVPALREMRPRDGTRRRRRNKSEKEELVDGVPAATKMSKATVLSKATEYICYLKSREVQLDRQVTALQMLVRSLEGGEELLAAWNAEVDRMQRLHPPADAAYGSGAAPMPFADDDADDSGNDEDDSPTDPDSHRSKMPRYMLGAFFGFSFLGGAADWTEHKRLAVAPSHTRVLGASHQLLMRSNMVPHHAHPYDHVPIHQLLFELLRTVLLVVFGCTILYALTTRYRRHRAYARMKRAEHLQTICPLPTLMQSPIEQAYEATPQSLEEACREYRLLSEAMPEFHTRLAFLRLVQQGTLATILAHVPLLDRLVVFVIQRACDPTILRLEKQVCLRRLELELALGARVQPSLVQRYLTLATWQTYLLATPHTEEERLLLALGYASLAPLSLAREWLEHQGAQVWNDARAVYINAAAPAHGTKHAIVGDVLGIPLDLASEYTASAVSDRDVGAAATSPLRNVLDALRNEELLSFWTALLSSLMRGSPHVQGANALRPHVLDVASDKTMLLGLRKQLAKIAQERPLQNTLATEQLLVAFATLALISGNIKGARHYARVVHHGQVRSRAGGVLIMLLLNQPIGAMPTAGPVDALASVVLYWMLLQRSTSMRPNANLPRPVEELEELTSQCLWEVVSPGAPQPVVRSASFVEQAKQAWSVVWHAPEHVAPAVQLAHRDWHRHDNATQRLHLPSLTHSLDTLLDHLTEIREQEL